jgi:hypothetical protein
LQTLSAAQIRSSKPQASRSSAREVRDATSVPVPAPPARPAGQGTSRRVGGSPRLTEKDERRFRAQVALPDSNGCMRWLGYVRKDGYASFYLAGKQVLIHRVSYVLAYGPIPEGLDVDHVKAKGCRYRDCSAPDHLEAVTPQENHRRGEAGVNMRRKTHCPQGHAYAGDNLIVTKAGSRRCRTCARATNQRYEERRRADSQF